MITAGYNKIDWV